jgi:uncharacterized membrane protein
VSGPAGPSTWQYRVPVILLATAGLTVATILTLYQVGLLKSVWEPFFGGGSRKVLTSALSQALPVPDAALGVTGYLTEAVLETIGGQRRWHDRPHVVFAAGLVAAGLGTAAIVLIAAQALLVQNFCTLCLTSAAISLLVAALVAPEALAATRRLRHRQRA